MSSNFFCAAASLRHFCRLNILWGSDGAKPNRCVLAVLRLRCSAVCGVPVCVSHFYSNGGEAVWPCMTWGLTWAWLHHKKTWEIPNVTKQNRKRGLWLLHCCNACWLLLPGGKQTNLTSLPFGKNRWPLMTVLYWCAPQRIVTSHTWWGLGSVVFALNLLVVTAGSGGVFSGRAWLRGSISPHPEVQGLLCKQSLDQGEFQTWHAAAVQHQDLIAGKQTWEHMEYFRGKKEHTCGSCAFWGFCMSGFTSAEG